MPANEELHTAETVPRHLVGYARVSMGDQDCQRQIDALVQYGVSSLDIFEDKASGKDMKRPGWVALWKDIRAGDVVVVLSLDRLGRDVLQILQTVEAMKARGVGLKLLTGEVDTETPIGRFVFNVMASFAQLERDLINERTMHGLAKARERGVSGGRPRKITNEMTLEAIRRFDGGEGRQEVADSMGVHKNSLVRRVEAHRKAERTKGNEHGRS